MSDFHSRTVHLDIIKVFYSPTDAPVNFLKNNIKIYIKTALTCFGAVTPSSRSAIFVLATASSRTRFLDHTQRRATVGRTPLDE